MKLTNEEIKDIQENLTFGIEIECYVREDKRDFENNRYGYSEYADDFPGFLGWKATYDSSLYECNDIIQSAAPDESLPLSQRRKIKFRNREHWYMPVEIISPILKGEAGLQKAMKVAETLKNKYKAIIKKSCGFHVHVGIPKNIQDKQKEIQKWIRNLIGWVGKYELALYASTGTPYRVGNHFCQSVRETQSISEFEGDWTEVEEKYNDHSLRYKVLNLNPLFTGKENIEFRVFQGTVEPIKVALYIQMGLGMAIRALKNGKSNFNPIQPRFLKTKGFGQQCAHQMMNTLGWQNRHNASIKWAGFLLNTEKYAKPIRMEFRRLAKKFDERINQNEGRQVDAGSTTYQLLQSLGYFN